jgi:predicted alpha/beta-hydrolase family hydrolase
MARPLVVETPQGPAHVHVQPAPEARGALVLGHGAAGGVTARDLVTSANVARELGFAVALVEQPYRVAGRRSPPRAPQLDAAWLAVVESLQARRLRGLPLVTGGRSSGARVACRTAEATGAAGVLCLAFPLQPPARDGGEPRPSRLHELDAVRVPTLVVQGTNDRFGMPPPGPHREVVQIAGDHALRRDLGALAEAVGGWLARVMMEGT